MIETGSKKKIFRIGKNLWRVPFLLAPPPLFLSLSFSPLSRFFLSIAVLPADSVGNEVISVAVDALRLAGSLEGFVSGLDLSFEDA